MPDVSRALLMPDWCKPADDVLKSLALYWDEIVVPDSSYRLSPVIRVEELNDPPNRSAVALELEEAGVIRRYSADVAAESLMPHGRPPNEDPDGELFLRIEKGDDGRTRFTGTLRAHIAENSNAPRSLPDPETRSRQTVEALEAQASMHTDALIARSQQCQAIAACNNLAPLAPSLLSHLASLSKDDREAPMMEGALMSVALDAFAVRSATPVKEILAFRERNMLAIQRFRAAITDLAMNLRTPEIAPESALSAARDTYRNRVEPELGALGDRLSESRIKFISRSLFGAAALSVTPLTAPTVAENAVRLGAQTINYKFSRKRLLEEHPYSYLHRLSTADFVLPRQLMGTDMVSPELAPERAVLLHYEAVFRIAQEMSESQDGDKESYPRYDRTEPGPST